MLFDLRSRGRRRTVQVIYLGLALLIGGGLVLFGVGSGTGGGGLLNGIGNSGSGGNQTSLISRQATSAQKAAERNPTSAAAWAAVISADYAASQQTGALNPSTGVYTAEGQRYLNATVAAWQRYNQLNKNPGTDLSILAARAYGALGDYSQEGDAWENVIQANPGQAKGYECLAVSAYAAKQTRKGDLAAAKAESLVPKLQRLTLKQELATAKTHPAVAAQC
jgi:hypothetical protein